MPEPIERDYVEAITDDDGQVLAIVHGPSPLSNDGRAAFRSLVEHVMAHADELLPPDMAARQDASRDRIQARNRRIAEGRQ